MVNCRNCGHEVNEAWAVESNFCSTKCMTQWQAWTDDANDYANRTSQKHLVENVLVSAGKVI